jgi:hypothetical protein
MIRLYALRRLHADRLSAIVGRDDVYLLEDGTPVWDGEGEFGEELARYRRADRMLLSLHRLLGNASSVCLDHVPIEARADASPAVAACM